MDWIYPDDYGKNLCKEALKHIPTERLQAIVNSCDRLGGSLCEICNFYLEVIEERKHEQTKTIPIIPSRVEGAV